MADSQQSDWSRLVLLSLAVLDEAIDHSRFGPVVRSLGLRCALAALYWCSDRSTRDPYVAFWKGLTAPLRENETPHVAALVRIGIGRTERIRIVRTLGLEFSLDLERDVQKLAGKLPGWREREERAARAKEAIQAENERNYRSTVSEAVFDAAVEERSRRDEERRGKDCGWL